MTKVSGLLLMACCLVVGCGGKPAVPPSGPTLMDATGETIALTPLPSRIISLAPSITHNIYLLGGSDKLVGVTKFCKLPPGETKPVISDLLNPSPEQITLLKPDLILATKEGNDKASITALRNIGLRVFVLDDVNSWAEIQQQFRQVAALLDKKTEAERLLADYNAQLAKVTNRNTHSAKVFIQMSDQYHTVAKNTFLDEAITKAGAVNIAHDALGRWPMFSLEQIIIANPDLIILTAMGTSPEASKAAWQKFPNLKAVKNNKIVFIEDDISCQPTPDHFVQMVETIVKLTQ